MKKIEDMIARVCLINDSAAYESVSRRIDNNDQNNKLCFSYFILTIPLYMHIYNKLEIRASRVR